MVPTERVEKKKKSSITCGTRRRQLVFDVVIYLLKAKKKANKPYRKRFAIHGVAGMRVTRGGAQTVRDSKFRVPSANIHFAPSHQRAR
jgi:hypothetical protein